MNIVEAIRKQRAKGGGNRKIKYIEGWVEFEDKKDAKMCALALNGQQIGGKKRHNMFYDDLWTVKYLPKFKWSNLTEKLAYDQKMREQRLRADVGKAKKEMNFYMEKIDLKKKLDKMEEKKMKQMGLLDQEDESQDHVPTAGGNQQQESDNEKGGDTKAKPHEEKKKKNILKMMKYHQRKRRVFKQRDPIAATASIE